MRNCCPETWSDKLDGAKWVRDRTKMKRLLNQFDAIYGTRLLFLLSLCFVTFPTNRWIAKPRPTLHPLHFCVVLLLTLPLKTWSISKLIIKWKSLSWWFDELNSTASTIKCFPTSSFSFRWLLQLAMLLVFVTLFRNRVIPKNDCALWVTSVVSPQLTYKGGVGRQQRLLKGGKGFKL